MDGFIVMILGFSNINGSCGFANKAASIDNSVSLKQKKDASHILRYILFSLLPIHTVPFSHKSKKIPTKIKST